MRVKRKEKLINLLHLEQLNPVTPPPAFQTHRSMKLYIWQPMADSALSASQEREKTPTTSIQFCRSIVCYFCMWHY